MTVISFPVPPYSNLPIEAQNYQPSRFVISGVTLGPTTTITTTVNMNYSIGQLIRLIIPPSFGCRQLNEQTGYVISIPTTNSVVVSINSVGCDAYIASLATTVAQILALGDISSGVTNTSRTGQSTAIPGSFINISS
jgi:hypothetical protein